MTKVTNGKRKCSICGEEYKDDFISSWDHTITKHSFATKGNSG